MQLKLKRSTVKWKPNFCYPFCPWLRVFLSLLKWRVKPHFLMWLLSLSHLLYPTFWLSAVFNILNDSLLLNSLPSVALHPLLALGQWHKIMCQLDWANRCPDHLAKHYSHPGFSLDLLGFCVSSDTSCFEEAWLGVLQNVPQFGFVWWLSS